MRRLTDRQLRQAKPRAAVYELADGNGLALRVTPSGVKSWALRYRTAGGDRRRIKIGRYPDVALATARRRAAELRDGVAAGADPQGERVAARSAMRLVDLVGAQGDEGWYLSQHVRTAGRIAKAKTDKGIANDRSAFGKYLRGRRSLLRKRVAEVTVADLNRIKQQAPPSTWRKLRNALVVCFRHAEELGEIPAGVNPALRTKANADVRRERFLSPAERRRLSSALDEAEKIGPRKAGGYGMGIVRALRLLELTGCRRGDVLSVRWEHVDTRGAVLRLATSKTGPREVPLTPQALAFLEAERRAGGVTRVRGLVCATREGQPIHPNNVTRAWSRIRQKAKLDGADGKPAVRLHDLRHSWASDAVSAGVPLYIVGKVLGHSQPSTTARYSHLHDEALRDGLQRAGEAIDRARGGRR